ncbi:MAG: hypothetical protein K6E91_02520 [Butyrivibrio sp.]|nr:hypothetical protein [Butyrivibrio sp.]
MTYVCTTAECVAATSGTDAELIWNGISLHPVMKAGLAKQIVKENSF